MPTLKDVRGGSCAMADGCFYDEDAESIQKIFTQNFLDHYTGDKTPFPLFFHSGKFTSGSVPVHIRFSSGSHFTYHTIILSLYW